MDFTSPTNRNSCATGSTKFLATRYDLEKSRSAAKTGAGLAARHLARVRR